MAQTIDFWHFNSNIDALAIVRAHENPHRRQVQGHRVNYLGVAVNTDKYFPTLKLENIVEPPPLPSNWHADISEFAGALRAVDLSGKTFTMIELGCGWGCWMNNTGVAAKRSGREPFVIGIEGDEGHIGFAREALHTNGFNASQYQLIRGIAAANSGRALFPSQASGVDWGSSPIIGAQAEREAELLATGKYEAVNMVSLKDAIGGRRIDLLHIDIQGGEADLVRECIDLISANVAYLLIGTHSREIEGDLFKTMVGANWALEIERPAVLSLPDGRPTITVDGVQAWRNRKLLPT